MKATIRITKYDFYADQIGEESIVRVAEITHCLPMRGGYSLIMLTTGNSIIAADSIEELEQKIDEAEGRARQEETDGH
jgi:hypothetical protein